MGDGGFFTLIFWIISKKKFVDFMAGLINRPAELFCENCIRRFIPKKKRVRFFVLMPLNVAEKAQADGGFDIGPM